MREKEFSLEDCERIKREYDEATPYRQMAFGIVIIGFYVMSIFTLILK